MSLRVVLDENVLVFALEATEADVIGLKCAELIDVLRERCEHQLIWTPMLFARYSNKAQSVSPTTIGLTARRRFFALVTDAVKGVMLDDSVEGPQACDLSQVKDDDLPLVRAGASAEALLVTEDEPLRNALAGTSCTVVARDVSGALSLIEA